MKLNIMIITSLLYAPCTFHAHPVKVFCTSVRQLIQSHTNHVTHHVKHKLTHGIIIYPASTNAAHTSSHGISNNVITIDRSTGKRTR